MVFWFILLVFSARIKTAIVCFPYWYAHRSARFCHRRLIAVLLVMRDAFRPLFHAGLAPKIVTFVPNREPYSSYLHQALSIPPAAIIWARGKSNNTLIEASSLAKLCRDNSWDSVILVADSHRMFRKFRAFIKAGVPIVYPANVTGDQQWMAPAKFIGVSQQAYWDLNGFECDWSILQQFRHKMVIRTLHEYLGIIFYAVIGYI